MRYIEEKKLVGQNSEVIVLDKDYKINEKIAKKGTIVTIKNVKNFDGTTTSDDIIVEKSVRINDIVLTKGDIISFKEMKLEESVMMVGEQTISDVCRVVQLYNQSYSKNKNIIRYTPDLFRKLAMLNLMSYAERYREEVDIDLLAMLKMKQPSSDITQLLKSLDCYTYQIEGSAEQSDEFKALKVIENDIINVVRSTKEYDKGYWGD